MKGFFKYVWAGLLGSVLAMIIVGILLILIISGIASSGDDIAEIKEKTVLTLSFDKPVGDRSITKLNKTSFSIDKKNGIHDMLETLTDAENDDRIKGIFMDMSSVSAGMATSEELRNALLKFKQSGKFIIAHADYYTHKSYYLASVADKVYLTPEGELQLMGLSANIMMFKSLLEKIGVEPEIIRHGKFKSAVEPFMLDEISEANRLQTGRYIGSLWETMLKGISEQRGISVADLNKYADSLTISSAKAAKHYNLVDDLKYHDQVIDELKTLCETDEDADLETVSFSDYINSEKEGKESKKFTKDRIAVIYAVGSIVSGKGNDGEIGSETLAKAIRDARKDKNVKAIVLRINSPGGSALASEVMWRETVLAEQAKPLIVSMGDVAASGGYYIACNADTIVAQPNTITGSIGVFGLLFNTTGLMKKIGVNVSHVNTNAYSDLANPSRKMTDYERNIIQKGVEDVYGTFIKHVAEGRGMTTAQIDSIGQGRVWSGADAQAIGLVDVMGGLDDALEIAREKANLDNYRLKEYPEKNEMSKILENFASEVKADVLKEELGSAYIYYNRIKEVQKIKGIQARIPYYIDIE